MQPNHILLMTLLSYIKKSMMPLCGLALLSFVTACQQNADEPSFDVCASQLKVNAYVADFEVESDTRTDIQFSDRNVSFLWAKGDALGVFPSGTIDSQVKFIVVSGAGLRTAQFDGGDWRLRSSSSYMTYYPYDLEGANATAAALPATFSGQCQKGNASTAHLGQHDYLAAPATEVSAEGYVDFSMSHLASIVQINITVPQADIFRRLRLSGRDLVTDALFDLTSPVPALTPVATAGDIDLELEDVASSAAGESLTFYMMMAPGKYSNEPWTFTLEGTMQDYVMTVTGRELKPGKIYSFSGEASAAEHPKAVLLDSLKFNLALRRLSTPGIGDNECDIKVERIVIQPRSHSTRGQVVSSPGSGVPVYAYYDEVSHELVISCKDDVIYAQKYFSFAFAYFKNLVEIEGLEHINTSEVTHFNSLFYDDSRLLNLDLRSFDTRKAETMANMFDYCSELWSVDLSSFDTSNVTSFFGMFRNCKTLPEVDIRHFKTTRLRSMAAMFFGCENLRSIDLSSFTTDNVVSMASLFCDCLNLSGPLDLSHFRTPSLKSLEDTFRNCRQLTSLDISGFETQNVNTMYRAFYGMRNLTSLNLGPDFVIISGCSLESAFYNLGIGSLACSVTCRPEVKDKMKLSSKVTYTWNYIE